MLKAAALFIIIAFTVQTFSSAFIVADYFINTNAYAKNCVNKAMTHMHCNGKCQMIKKIQQQQNKSEQNSERKFETKDEVFSSKSFFPELVVVNINSPKKYSLIKVPGLSKLPRNIFHPPPTIARA